MYWHVGCHMTPIKKIIINLTKIPKLGRFGIERSVQSHQQQKTEKKINLFNSALLTVLNFPNRKTTNTNATNPKKIIKKTQAK